MSILNRPSDGLSTVLLALHRALIAYGPQEEDRLLQLVAPEAITDQSMARKTLTRWKQLGVFETTASGRVALTSTLKRIECDDLRGFRSAMLKLVLSEENNPGLSEEREDDDARSEISKATDFSRAAAWTLAQDPYAFGTTHREIEALLKEQRPTTKLFSNDTRWQGFVEWATFLGVACDVKGGLVPNPYFAIECVLDAVFGKSSELGQRELLVRLADALPIVDGGRYRRATDALITQPWRTYRDNEVSPCVSLGLRTLQEKKILRLESRSDAPQAMLLGRGGRDMFTFSHCIRVIS